jgi:hypothetical protein
MYYSKIAGILLLVIVFSVCANVVVAQEPEPGENPIFRDRFTADPATLVHNDTLYVYAGHDEAQEGQMFNITKWVAYSTTDMKTWTSHGTVLKPTDFEWAVGDAWASEVEEINGKFYYYTTVQHGPSHTGKAIGVAVGDHPLGPFEDARGTALVNDSQTQSDNPWDDIDPTVFLDDDGIAYMAWGNPILYFAKLKPNMTDIEGEIEWLHLPNYTEGPWFHKRNDTYYLSYPCFAHQGMWEKVCYAKAPKITGPWTYHGILTDRTEGSYTIHPAIVEFKDQWYFFYHTAKLTIDGQSGTLGRRAVSVEYLYYNEDGTIKPIQQTINGVSESPNPPNGYQAPVFNPAGQLATVESDIKVIQNISTAATSWSGNPQLYTMDNPYDATTASESFNRNEPASPSLGQTFTVDSDFRLKIITLFTGDGFGTIEEKPVTLALYELVQNSNGYPGSYSVGENLLGSSDGLKINYIPQAQGLLQFQLPESRQPTLKAGRTYVLELQGERNSAALFWYRTNTDHYSNGAAYMDRSLITNESTSTDFGMALSN